MKTAEAVTSISANTPPGHSHLLEDGLPEGYRKCVLNSNDAGEISNLPLDQRAAARSAKVIRRYLPQGWLGPFEKGMPFCLFDEKGKSVLHNHFAFFPKMT